MPPPTDKPAPAEKFAAAARLIPPPTLSDALPPNRRLSAPLALAMPRAARGSPSALATTEGTVPSGVLTGSGRGLRSTVGAGLRLLWNSTFWLARVRLMLERSGTPSAEKKSIVSLNCSTTPLKL